MRRLRATRYVTPLREGGSMPAIVDTDAEPVVVKFRGAGQGPKALIAELLAAELGLTLGLSIPQPALVSLEEGFGRSEPDPEIQDILRGSIGLNFGLRYLAGAFAYDPAAEPAVPPELAADIVWFDAYITNVDRTVRNTNLLWWRDGIWLIDHGASLYFHHSWHGWENRLHSPFPLIKDHVLLPVAGDLWAADERLRPRLTNQAIQEAVHAIPEEWLDDEPPFSDSAELRAAYVTYLEQRRDGPNQWLQEAISAQARGPERLTIRATHRVV
jgi:hypothetical protein